MVDTHLDDDNVWQGGATKYEDSQGWAQCQYNSWTQHGITYRNPFGIGSIGDESSILTLLENMHVKQRECHEEESRRNDEFEVAQVESFK